MEYIGVDDKLGRCIEEDIQKCEALITAGYCNRNDVIHLVRKYEMYFPNFGKGLGHFCNTASDSNQIEQLKLVYEKLKMINEIGYLPTFQAESNSGVTITNIASASNQIQISIDLKNSIMQDTSLNSDEKNTLYNLLLDAENLPSAERSKKNLWEKLKPVLGFFGDKSFDLAIAYLPQIIAFFSNLAG